MSATPKIRKAFEESILVIRLDELVPTKVLPKSVLLSTKYARIARSVAEEGLVEPLVVARGPGGKFQILDGHARFSALLGSGATDAR
jgi:ParB-like chromosome segregation protein Spo0J